MLTRRAVLALPLAAALTARAGAQPRPAGAMQLALHQNTSRGAGFRGSLEGWARAGIRYVELTDVLLDEFLARDTLTGARKLLEDLGLTPVSAAAVLPDVWIPGPARAASLDTWRRRCEQFAALGLDRLYCPSITTRPVTEDDFAATPDCIREVGDVAAGFGLTAMIEFARTSTHLATLPSTLEVIRAAGHPSVRPMLDFFHFYAGLSKLEDLDLLRPGEIAHVHFQDLKPGPRELIDNAWRLIPGDGIAPVVHMLRKLAEKGYAGPLSVELFRSELVDGDPFAVAAEIRTKCERVMREAGVL
ncbi:MAG TPA: sugar phosphate isomerase/epimerase family protein [Gammaproteobacteria bacterium]